MNTSLKLVCVLSVSLVIFLTACASSKITGEWQNPDITGKKYSHILVIGVAKQPDRRKFYEDEFVRQLNRQGIMAVASHTIIPRDKMQDRNAILQGIEGMRFDGVIITRLQGLAAQYQGPPDKPYQVPSPYYNNMYDYYNTSFSIAPSRSYAETHEYLQLETNLYDAATEKLAYSITTDTFIRQKFEGRITDYIETVVDRLQGNKLI